MNNFIEKIYGNKNKRTIFYAFVSAALLLAIGYAVFSFMLFSSESTFDSSTSLGDRKLMRATYTYAAVGSVIVVLIAAFLMPFAADKNKNKEKNKDSAVFTPQMRSGARGLTLLSALCGFFLVATVVMQIIVKLNGSLGTGLGKYQGNLHTVSLVLALPASFYFLYSIFAEHESLKIRSLFGLTLVLWSLSCVIVTYLFMEIPINSPARIHSMLSFISIMLFFIEEVRFGIRKPLPRLYVALALIAAIFTLGDSLPMIILALFKKNGFAMSLSTIYNCFELSVCAYALLRVHAMAPAKEKEEEKEEEEKLPAQEE